MKQQKEVKIVMRKKRFRAERYRLSVDDGGRCERYVAPPPWSPWTTDPNLWSVSCVHVPQISTCRTSYMGRPVSRAGHKPYSHDHMECICSKFLSPPLQSRELISIPWLNRLLRKSGDSEQLNDTFSLV